MKLADLEEKLSDICKKSARIALIGVGNYLRADDFLGVTIIQNLKDKVQKDSILLIEAETAPIDFLHIIQEWNPTHLLVIDAVNFKAKPGTFNLITREEMTTFTLSSHKRALTLLIDLLSHYLPALEIIIMGIQPAIIDFKVGISKVIKNTIQRLTDVLVNVFSRL